MSTSSCWCTNATNPVPGVVEGSPASREYDGGFKVGLIGKDLRLAISLGDEAGVNLDTAKHSEAYYTAMEEGGKGDLDWGYAYQYIKNGKKA